MIKGNAWDTQTMASSRKRCGTGSSVSREDKEPGECRRLNASEMTQYVNRTPKPVDFHPIYGWMS